MGPATAEAGIAKGYDPNVEQPAAFVAALLAELDGPDATRL